MRLHEREILRVSATVTQVNGFDTARREVLTWAQNRAGGPLPEVAWEGSSFEYMPGGRTTFGACIREQGVDLWALRGDDPDKTVPGRTWTTEVAIGLTEADRLPRISVRLVVSTSESEPIIEPAVPGLLRQIASKVGLQAGGFAITDLPRQITTVAELDNLIAMLEARDRRLPVIVATGDERASDPNQPLLQLTPLAQATLGLVHVVVVSAARTYGLSDAFGKVRSVYNGGVRVYMPGFSSASDPHAHMLYLPDLIRRNKSSVLLNLRRQAAVESLRRSRLGHEVIAFAAVRSAAFRREQEIKITAGASDVDLLDAAEKRIEAMQAELQDVRNQIDLSLEEAIQFEDRAKSAESQLFNARARIQQLEGHFANRGQMPDSDLQLPKNWDGFADWCDQVFIGRIVLAVAARKGVRGATFGDVALVAKSLLWLAGPCRDNRINGGGSMKNVSVGQGVENSPCGTDTFEFEFQGRRVKADWHVKSGGNTRDPVRCLRIYYAWDDITQQIVVADMPAHRRTGAT